MKEDLKYNVIKVKDGKVVAQLPAKGNSLTNADLFRSAEYGLYRLREIKNIYVLSNISYNNKFPESLTKKQIAYLTDLFNSTDNYLYNNPLLNPVRHRITKAMRKEIRELKKIFVQYYSQLNSMQLPQDLNQASQNLINFILELVESFCFFDSMILDIRKLPNRPLDSKIRILVDNIIVEYQTNNKTSKYPTFTHVKKSLDLICNKNCVPELCERQYRNFRIWRDRGTYWWYIQPRSRH